MIPKGKAIKPFKISGLNGQKLVVITIVAQKHRVAFSHQIGRKTVRNVAQLLRG